MWAWRAYPSKCPWQIFDENGTSVWEKTRDDDWDPRDGENDWALPVTIMFVFAASCLFIHDLRRRQTAIRWADFFVPHSALTQPRTKAHTPKQLLLFRVFAVCLECSIATSYFWEAPFPDYFFLNTFTSWSFWLLVFSSALLVLQSLLAKDGEGGVRRGCEWGYL